MIRKFHRQTSVPRFGLILMIGLLHLWVFFGYRATIQIPKGTASRYIEIWNVTRPATPVAIPLPPVRPRNWPAPSRRDRPPSLAREATSRTQQTQPARPAEPAARLALKDQLAPSSSGTPAGQGENSSGFSGDPGTVPTAPRPLNMDQLRKLARDGERQRVKSPLEQVRENEHVNRSIETHVANAATRAARKDCQTAYSSGSAGILALIPLIYGTVTDDGCKWK